MENETFYYQNKLKCLFLLSFWFNLFFFLVCYGGTPLCFPVVAILLRLPRDVSPPKDWWDFLFRQRARVSATSFASRNLGDGKNLQGFGTQIIIKL